MTDADRERFTREHMPNKWGNVKPIVWDGMPLRWKAAWRWDARCVLEQLEGCPYEFNARPVGEYVTFFHAVFIGAFDSPGEAVEAAISHRLSL